MLPTRFQNHAKAGLPEPTACPLPSGDTNKETANNDGISRGLWLRLHLDKDNADRHNVTYCIHAVDLIQSLLQELLIAALGHQLECRLQEALPVLEQQGGYISDALEGKKAMGGGVNGKIVLMNG